MTVTSLPAPAAPADSAPADQSNTDSGDGAAGSGFATVLAGLNDRGTPTNGPKTGDRNAAATGKPGAANAPTDPVTLALLGALAGIAAIDPATDPAAPTTASELVPQPTTAPGESPANAAPERSPLATDPALPAPAPVVAPAQPSPLVPDVAGATNPASTPAVAAAVPVLATAPPIQVNPETVATAETVETVETVADSDDEAAAPATTTRAAPAPKSTAAAAAAAPTPAAESNVTGAATAATTTANSGATPIVRSDPAPKSGTIAENVMITAASAAADHAPPAPATVAATAPQAPAAPGPPPPAEQLVAVMRPLHRGPDGTYQLRIEMRPPELGRVDLRVEMRDGVLHASIHTEHAETAELVRAALDDLRARLDADGMRSGQLTVDAHGAGTPGRDQQAPASQRPADLTTATADATAVPKAPASTTSIPSDSLLDVRI